MLIPVLCVSLLAVAGASCNDKEDNQATTTSSAPTVGEANTSYDTFLAVLAEYGWVPDDDQKLTGKTTGVGVTVLGCWIQLALVEPRGIDFVVTSVNGQSLGSFGEEAEALLSPPNLTKTLFEGRLTELTASADIELRC